MNLTEGERPVEAGCFVATDVSSGIQVGSDRYTVSRGPDGLVVSSRQTRFGRGGGTRQARFLLESDWTPRALEVDSGPGDAMRIDFGKDTASIVSWHGRSMRRLHLSLRREEALVLLEDGFSFPLHVVRRFRAGDVGVQVFRLLPSGTCEARPRADLDFEGERLRGMHLQLLVGGVEDHLFLAVDGKGVLKRFLARNRNLLVRHEAGTC